MSTFEKYTVFYSTYIDDVHVIELVLINNQSIDEQRPST